MSKRKLYKNFNKRKKVNTTRIFTITLCTCIIGSYTWIKLKDNNFIKDIGDVSLVNSIKGASIWNKFDDLLGKENVITSSSIKTELEEIEKEDEPEQNTEVASVNEMLAYTIQVASLENENDLKKIEEVMNEYKIPSSTMKIDNAQKIQVYVSFDEDNIRDNVKDTKNYFSDAFLTKIQIPMLSLEYTKEYSYMKDIADNLNALIETYKKESTYWISNKNDLESYNEILTSRKAITEKLEENAQKIDYPEMQKFKEKLISYIDEVNTNILTASKNANENKGYISQSLLLSSIQKYNVFVQSMK